MIFVDTNVFIYAVGRPHPLRDAAREILRKALLDRGHLVTSAEVLQELVHYYLGQRRPDDLDASLRLALEATTEVWPVVKEDVLLARDLASSFPGLEGRDLVHLACCRRRQATAIETFDRGLAAAFAG